MITKLYCILFLSLLVIISCSEDESLEGSWVLSVDSILKSLQAEEEIDPTFKPELEEKMINKIQNSIVYTFLDNGDFKLELASDADSVNYSKKGAWSSDGSLLEINQAQSIDRWYFQITGQDLKLMNPSDSTDIYILNKIFN